MAEAEETVTVTLDVNGESREVEIVADETLVETLRRRFGLRSVRATCGIGICGTCTVQLDGLAVSSCSLLTQQVTDAEITTSEGLADGDDLAAVQEAFLEHRAYQCSYCIPGMVVAVDACMKNRPDVTFEELREELAGNLCRCGTYPQILEAARDLISARNQAG
ncbi:MAG: (2Fe-2S)-binding protein [Nitriliruptoraceae bacterium]